MRTIYIDIDSDNSVNGYGSSPTSDTSIKIEVEDNHPVLLSFDRFSYSNGKLVPLSQDKVDKIKNTPTKPTAEERISELENVILQLMMEG